MGPQLQFGAVIQIGASFSVGAVAIALIGYPSTDYSAETIVTHIMDIGNLRYEMGYASAISVFLFLMLLIANSVLRNLLRKISKD
jgi:multiple sugar transport system permease protein